MDGTMVDNMMVHHQAWQQKFASLGIQMSMAEVKEQVHGVNEEILERLFGDRFTREERRRISAEKEADYRAIFKTQLVLVRGVEDFLRSAKEANIPMAIATAAPPENVDFVLDNLQLRGYFGGVVHAHHVKKGKPDPETFLLAAASIDIPIEDCLVFEDSLTGAHTAANAGCSTIIVTTTHSQEEFDSFSHIIKFISDFSRITLDKIGVISS
jgi:HAD superfamily hydrolase (TIGR01509 family)